jgi:hypothetical protein
VADQQPPWFVAGERETVLRLLQFQRESLVRKVEGVTEADARWSPVPSGTSLLWLVTHLTWAERLWILERFAGEDGGSADGTVGADDTLAGAVAAYQDTWDVVADVVGAASLDEPCRDLADGRPSVDLRWVLAHLLEETARHAGHADIIREQLDGHAGR